MNPRHRFLDGLSLVGADLPVWKVVVDPRDAFFDNPVTGTLPIRRTLEVWAHRQGAEICILVDSSGRMSFDGSVDPGEAERWFRELPARPMQGQAFNPSQPIGAVQSTPQSAQAQQDAQAAADVSRFRNDLTLIGRLLERAGKRPALVVFENVDALDTTLRSNESSVPDVARLREMIAWRLHPLVSQGGLLVLLAPTASADRYIDNLLPEDGPVAIRRIRVPRPRSGEIEAALRRFALRRGFRIDHPASVARAVSSAQTLPAAVSRVAELVREGRPSVSTRDVFGLPDPNVEEVRNILTEAKQLVGLDDFKETLSRLSGRAETIRRDLLELGRPPEDPLHLVFTGPPGTGKTTAARLVARMFHALGILRTSNVVEVGPSDIVSPFRSQTSVQMTNIATSALGGVLFIDEAHQLAAEDNSHGHEAIRALVPILSNQAAGFVCILAGYEAEMSRLYALDPGLERRFPVSQRIRFTPLSPTQLADLVERETSNAGLEVDEAALSATKNLVRQRATTGRFGSAAGVRLVIRELRDKQAVGPRAGTNRFTREDVPEVVRRDDAVYSEAKRRLDELVGLESVKRQIDDLAANVQYQLEEASYGRGQDETFHPGNLLFLGPPGVGKTTVARLMTDILFGMGALERRISAEYGRADLVAEYVGQTAPRVRRAVEAVRGGLFFLDEAYTLVETGQGASFAKEAVETLVQCMTIPENRGTVFVFAGYREEMVKFMAMNDGLNRRITEHITFENLTPEDCWQVFEARLASIGHLRGEGLRECFLEHAFDQIGREGEKFGNAGWAESLARRLVRRASRRLLNVNVDDAIARRTLTRDHLEDLINNSQQGAHR